MLQIIDELWSKARHIVSDEYDAALARLGDFLPLTIHEVPSGTQCWTWRVPNKWGCPEAWIEELPLPSGRESGGGTPLASPPNPLSVPERGSRLVDLADHPLHIVYGSLPFEGVVSREELRAHLHVCDERPEAIPYEFKYYERDWGFCVPKSWLGRFTADSYRVKIVVTDEPGTLKIGEHFIRGQSDRCVVIVSHLCHPSMVNDDVAGVAVSVDVARRIKDPYYSYRFLYLPETIGSVAYLATHEDLIPDLAAGLFLEMLASAGPLVLQHSYEREARIDHVASHVLSRHQPDLQEGDFRTIIGNDELVFDGPGVRIPMISLSRWPYPEYHTSDDNPSLVVPENLVHAREAVLDLIRHLEADYVPVRNFRGPLFMSGYGLWVDWRTNLKLNRALEWVTNNLEGDYSISELAARTGADFWELKEWLDRALAHGVIEKRPAL
jgi:aminopeptidase-like protein